MEGCQTYQIKPCEHHINGTRQPCHGPAAPTPHCQRTCTNPSYKVPYEKVKFYFFVKVELCVQKFPQDKTYGQKAYSVKKDVNQIQLELMTNGPVVASFRVYADFFHYKSGVYQHINGTFQGGHSVRLLGWGEEAGTDYWLVANSWNSDWGDAGTFRMLRGSDHCGFESGIVAGIPRSSK